MILHITMDTLNKLSDYAFSVCPDPPSIGSCGNVEVVNNLAIYTCMNNVAFRNTPHDRITCENGVWQGEQVLFWQILICKIIFNCPTLFFRNHLGRKIEEAI